MELQKMAREYRHNAAVLELRVIQLQRALRRTEQLELRRRIKRRIGLLRVMIGESRRTAYDLEHYYDRKAHYEKHCVRGRCR
ncbi:MAG: hypothetical protein EOM63_03910 [Clostridia bacterium]|nr:hypothetical protein [Clostridia bacterium]